MLKCLSERLWGLLKYLKQGADTKCAMSNKLFVFETSINDTSIKNNIILLNDSIKNNIILL